MHCFLINKTTVLDISARPLAQASVKSVGRVQILDHSPVWRVQFSSPRNCLTIKIKNVFTLHFGTKIPKDKLAISILQSFVFRNVSNVLYSAKQYGFPLVIITYRIYLYKVILPVTIEPSVIRWIWCLKSLK